MKKVKHFALLATAAACTVSAHAGILTGYNQNFESVTDPAEINWALQNGDVQSVITKDEAGNSYFRVGHLNSKGNGRWSYLLWGQDVLNGIPAAYANNNIIVSFDFALQSSNNQYDTNLAILTEDDATFASKATTNPWTDFALKDVVTEEGDGGYPVYQEGLGNFFFSLKEQNTTNIFSINGNASTTFTNTSNTWYHLESVLNQTTKVVTTKVTTLDGSATVLEASRTLGGNTIPTGLYLYHARYTNVLNIDNIKVGVVVDFDVPETPGYALIGIDQEKREYKFSCASGTMKYALSNGLEGLDADEEPLKTVGIIDDIMKDGVVFTKSGTLSLWAESGGLSSDTVFVDIDCSVVKLPAPVATMTAAQTGSKKSYQISIDNSSVPTKPNIGYKYVIFDKDGNAIQRNDNADEDAINNSTLTFEAGTLAVWAVSYGFEASDTLFIRNDTQYSFDEANDVIDFAHMSAEDIASYGFEATTDLNNIKTSGELNWTARFRIYDYILKEGVNINNPQVGDTVLYTAASLAGMYNADDPATDEALAGLIGNSNTIGAQYFSYHPIKRFVHSSIGIAPVTDDEGNVTTATADSATAAGVFKHVGLWWYEGLGNKAMPVYIGQNIGLYGNSTAYNALPIYFHGLADDDVVLVYTLNNYGDNSIHNLVASEADAIASQHAPITNIVKGNGEFTINRIDEALARIEILHVGETIVVAQPNFNASTAVKNVSANNVAPADNTIYNLQGQVVSPSALRPGIYIQNGKKFIVR